MPNPAETDQSRAGVLFETKVEVSGVYSNPQEHINFGDVGLRSSELDRLLGAHIVFQHPEEGIELADRIRALRQEGRKVVLTISEAPENTQ